MFMLMLTLFILVCIVLIVVVLLQSSKGGGLAGSFGGAGSDSSVLGSRGTASLLGKITVYLAGAFMLLSLILAVLSSRVPVEDMEDGIIARQRQEGGLDVFNVDENANILNQIETEAASSGSFDTSGEGATEEAAEGGEDQTPPPGNE